MAARASETNPGVSASKDESQPANCPRPGNGPHASNISARSRAAWFATTGMPSVRDEYRSPHAEFVHCNAESSGQALGGRRQVGQTSAGLSHICTLRLLDCQDDFAE